MTIKLQFNRDAGSEHLMYPGYEAWCGYIKPTLSKAENAVETRNPTTREVSARIFIGPNLDVQKNLEKLSREPGQQMKETDMDDLLKRGLPLPRPEYLWVKVVWGPGETVTVPREFLDSLREVRGGVIVAGAAAMIEIVGEEHPPELHAALVADPLEVGAGRRRR